MAIPKKVKDAVLERDGYRCVLQLAWCQIVAVDADHRANRQNGGARSGVLDKPSNLVAACRRCNGAKEEVTKEVRDKLIKRGVRVESHSTHAKTAARALETPVTYPDGTVWLLDDDGGKERA